MILNGFGDRESGIVDHQVHTAKGQNALGYGRIDRGGIAHIQFCSSYDITTKKFHELCLGLGQPFIVQVVQDHTSALLRKTAGNGLTDATAAAGDQCHAATQRLGLGHPLQLGLFQEPVFNIERFLTGQGCVGRDGLRALHHIDGVDVELCRHTGRLLILRKGEHPHTRVQDDDRIRIAQGRTVRMLAGFVIFSVARAIGFEQRSQGVLELLCIGQIPSGRQVQHQRSDLGPKEMVRAARSHRCQPVDIIRIDEFQDACIIGEMPDHPLFRGTEPAQDGRQGDGLTTAIRLRQRLDALTSEGLTLTIKMLLQVFSAFFYDFQGIDVRLIGRVSPGEESVRTEHDPSDAWVLIEAKTQL